MLIFEFYFLFKSLFIIKVEYVIILRVFNIWYNAFISIMLIYYIF